MKLNLEKVATLYSTLLPYDMIAFNKLEYGWYNTGRAFIAMNGEIMTFKEAFSQFVPKGCYTLYDSFFIETTRYDKNLNGIVHFLIDKYNQ